MFNAFERMVAFRYLRSRRKEGFISVVAGFSFLGICLGVATLIVVMAVMDGFRAELLKRILGINAHISVVEYNNQINDYDTLADSIKKIPGVLRAAPLVQGQILATANEENAGAVVRGISKNNLLEKKIVSENILGKLSDFGGNSVIIGSRLARSLRLVPGDKIRLISPETTATFIGNMPRIKDYYVAGLFEVGMFEYDSSTIFMPLAAAQLYFRHENSVSSIEIDVANPENTEAIKEQIVKLIGTKYQLLDWQQANANFFNSLKVERNVMFLILTLIILVAAFNIISGMVMLVTGKGREIAIMRTMGASRSAVMRIFIMTGAAIGFIGTFLGLLLGVGFATNIETIRHWLEGLTNTELFAEEIYFLSQLPADLQTDDVITVVAMSLLLSLLATIYPAWRAARISPAEGVRYE